MSARGQPNERLCEPLSLQRQVKIRPVFLVYTLLLLLYLNREQPVLLSRKILFYRTLGLGQIGFLKAGVSGSLAPCDQTGYFATVTSQTVAGCAINYH